MKQIIIARPFLKVEDFAGVLESNGFVVYDPAADITLDEAITPESIDAVMENMMDADICILVPTLAMQLATMFPQTSFHLIYMQTNDDELREIAKKQGISDEDFDKLDATIKDQFDKFDEALDSNLNSKDIPDNIKIVYREKYSTKPDDIINNLKVIKHDISRFNNLKKIVEQSLELGIVRSSKEDHITVVYHKLDEEKETLVESKEEPIELFVDILLSDPEGFGTILSNWLSQDINIGDLG